MKLRTIKGVNFSGKKVLLRTGFDVPMDKNGKILDDSRIKESLATIRYLLKKGAKIIIIAHNGRPAGKYVKELNMDETAKRLQKLLKIKVKKLDDCIGNRVKKQINKSKEKIIVLENLRFHLGEEKNDSNFAKKLASLGDIYVNDAFANAHRQHASMMAITKFLPSYAGLLLEKEIKNISQFISKKTSPFVGIIGGAKISDKLGVIKKLSKKADFILLGGALANTILKAQGIQVGKSLIEPKMVQEAEKFDLTENKIKIPVDVVVASEKSQKAKIHDRPVGKIRSKELILDIGEDTVSLYKHVISHAKKIFWAGPMGMFEIKKFAQGSYQIGRAIASSKAQALAGGGDTLNLIDQLKLRKKFTFVSTGGGALLEFLEKGILPSLKPLICTNFNK
jgi:phosphoglycerate kinase